MNPLRDYRLLLTLSAVALVAAGFREENLAVVGVAAWSGSLG